MSMTMAVILSARGDTDTDSFVVLVLAESLGNQKFIYFYNFKS